MGGGGLQTPGEDALLPQRWRWWPRSSRRRAARPAPGRPASGTEDRRSVVTDSPENGLAVRDALRPTTFVRTDPVFFSFQPCWARRRSVVTPIRRARAGRRSGFARGTQLAMAAGLPGLSLALVPSPWVSGSRSMVHGHPRAREPLTVMQQLRPPHAALTRVHSFLGSLINPMPFVVTVFGS